MTSDVDEWKQNARRRLESGTMTDAEWDEVTDAILVIWERGDFQEFDPEATETKMES